MRKRKLHILPRFVYQSLRWLENEISNVGCNFTFSFQLERHFLPGADNVGVEVANDQRQLGGRVDRSEMYLWNEQDANNYRIDAFQFFGGWCGQRFGQHNSCKEKKRRLYQQ